MATDQDVIALEARMSRLEALFQRLLTIQTTTQTNADELTQMRALLQEISPKDRPEMQAIREALASGNKLKAITLYRNAFGVSLQEAQAAVDAL